MGSEDQREGPWGGTGGDAWEYRPKGGITDIIFRYGDVIDSLTFICDSSSKKFGGKGGDKKAIIKINWPSEYLISISGKHIIYEGHRVIASLCFTTNYGTLHKVCGSLNDDETRESFGFSLNDQSLEDQAFVGFFGREANFIDAIGIYYNKSSIVTSKVNGAITMAMDLPREVGPWGGNKGQAWDYGPFGGLNQIEVYVGNGVIHAIQCRYQNRDGNSVLSNLQGGGGASTIYKIELDHSLPEYLIGITGFYGAVDGNCCQEVVRSISFYTNKGKHGPFGSETGTFFSSPASNAKVVGFHGRSGEYLDAIGVHVEYC